MSVASPVPPDYASVTWVDEQFGLLMRELEQLGLQNDTVVVLSSDHGYKVRVAVVEF